MRKILVTFSLGKVSQKAKPTKYKKENAIIEDIDEKIFAKNMLNERCVQCKLTTELQRQTT